MKVKSQKKEKNQALGYILSLAAMAAVVAVFAAAVLNFSGRTGAREEETLRKAVARASVQCYAIEGRYPRDLSYLQKNYGLLLDNDHFVYHYQPLGDNLMPQISVFYLPQEQ